MTPEAWLDLAKKHIDTPDLITEEELAQLRSNYTIWNSALEYHKIESKQQLGTAIRTCLGGKIVPPEIWNQLCSGEAPEDVVTAEQAATIIFAQAKYGCELTLLSTSRRKMDFYKKFDKEFETVNGEQPAAVQEILWKTKADRLLKAIDAHRRAHVLANKEPNGLDFALWAEVDLEEFHPSRHAGMQATGRITFHEG